MKLNADNLKTDVKDGQLVIEPQYVQYLREHNYAIEAINEIHTVPSESSDGAHLVVNIQTYEYPRKHEKLDVVEHETNLWVCDCWSFRQNSNDVSKGLVKPGGSCKHVRAVDKVQRAKNDEKQVEL